MPPSLNWSAEPLPRSHSPVLRTWLRPVDKRGVTLLAQLDRDRVASRALWYPGSGFDLLDLAMHGQREVDQGDEQDGPALFVHVDPCYAMSEDGSEEPRCIQSNTREFAVRDHSGRGTWRVELHELNEFKLAPGFTPIHDGSDCIRPARAEQRDRAWIADFSVHAEHVFSHRGRVLLLPLTAMQFMASIAMQGHITPRILFRRASGGWSGFETDLMTLMPLLYSIGCRAITTDQFTIGVSEHHALELLEYWKHLTPKPIVPFEAHDATPVSALSEQDGNELSLMRVFQLNPTRPEGWFSQRLLSTLYQTSFTASAELAVALGEQAS